MTAEQEKRVTDNLGLIHGVLRKYTWTNKNYEDYYQAGCVGLVMAAQRYDPGRGIKFSTYASSYIRAAIQDQYSKYECSTLKLPRDVVYQDGTKPFPICHSLQDAPEDTCGMTYEDMMPDDSNDIDNLVSDIAFREKLAALPEREQKIAALLIAGKSQQQIADAVGTSQANVSRLAHKIGKAIRGD